MVLILSSTVCPVKDTVQLTLQDEQERLKQYKECIRFYLEETVLDKIVLCDNSGVRKRVFEEECLCAEKLNKTLEILSFRGDSEKVRIQGKGYGEGEILKYVLENSEILKEEPFFIKVTGRLIIRNINGIISKMDREKLYINVFPKTKEAVDTRVYAMPKAIYQKYFRKSYEEVEDRNNQVLERIFYQVIARNHLTTYNFPCFPQFIGQSGSTGEYYGGSKLDYLKKDMLSKLQHYQVKI